MNETLLKKILADPNLPTLPGNAAEVVQLCRHGDVPMDQLARVICRDPALALKVLHTVNSAAYGLRNQVTTISHALVLLGMETVKSVALSFTLVGSLKDVRGQDFDPTPIWQRSLISAVSARSIALKMGGAQSEEAFLAGLLQDMGILALIQTLGSPYIDLLRKVGDTSARLHEVEQKYLKLDHTQVGEALAEKWNLPPVLTLPIRFHEQPEVATGEGQRTALAVALGNKAAVPFLARDAKAPLKEYLKYATKWFNMDETTATSILKAAAGAIPDMGKLFDISSGSIHDIEAILAEAERIRGALGEDGEEGKKAS